MGQPGHVNASRLGISNFWNYNSLDYDKRNFLNNILIKKILIYLYSYTSLRFKNIFYNNKWFLNLKHNHINLNIFYREKIARVHFRDEVSHYFIRQKMFYHFSSKIQIFRFNNWLCVIWYLYNQNFNLNKFKKFVPVKKKSKNEELIKLCSKFDYLKKKILKIFMIKLFIYFKFKNFKIYNNIYDNLFLYNL